MTATATGVLANDVRGGRRDDDGSGGRRGRVCGRQRPRRRCLTRGRDADCRGYGTLTLNADGSYSYDGDPNVVHAAGTTDMFVYTIKDGDGDTLDDDADDQPDGRGSLRRTTAT